MTTPLPMPFKALGLDPADLGFDTDDERSELHAGDGPLIVITDYDHNDPDAIRAVAEWWDRVAEVAGEIAGELRDQANAVCETCNGHGTIGWDDRECRACSGSGRVA